MKVTLENARISFTQNLFRAGSFQPEQPPKYGSTFIIEPGSKSEKAMKKAISDVANEKWASKGQAIMKQLVASGKVCLRSGDEKTNYDGFEGNRFVSTSSKKRPTVVDRDRSPLTEEDGRVYPGCYVNAIIEVWPQDNQFGKRINAELTGVQFVKDGEPLGGGAAPATEDDFPKLDGDEEPAAASDDWDTSSEDDPW